MRALAELRKAAKDKELNALLSGEHDSRSCFLEVSLYNLLKFVFDGDILH